MEASSCNTEKKSLLIEAGDKKNNSGKALVKDQHDSNHLFLF